MPYASVSEVPDYVPKAKKKQWLEVWNSEYKQQQGKGKTKEESEQIAYAAANAVAGPNAKEAVMKSFSKFIPFAKVDVARREVWGIVTAEIPDKDNEVCDYAGSKPFYQAVIDEMSKATDGANYFPLRYMHQLEAVGKCIGFDFRDADREIFMGFKVVDDEAWNKVLEKVLTGFSHGGKIVEIKPDPVFEGCKRYIADPSEISLVDNPCLANAHFAMVKLDGTVELCKFARTLPPVVGAGRLEALEAEIILIKCQMMGKAKTKRVDGEDLPVSAFLIVLDPEKTATWKLPVKFSTDAKTKSHLRNALALFNQLKGVPQAKKDAAWKELLALCEKHGIDVADEKKKLAAVFSWLRKLTRTHVNQLSRTVAGGNVGLVLATVDDQLGQLSKGLYEVSRLSQVIQDLAFLVYNVAGESEWEGDESPLPGLLADNVDSILDTLLRMVEEESEEMRADLRSRVS